MAKNNKSSNHQFSLRVRYWVTGQGPVVSCIPVDLSATRLLESEAISSLEPVAVEDSSLEDNSAPSRVYRILNEEILKETRKEIERVLTSAIVNQKQLEAVLSLVDGSFAKMEQSHWDNITD